MTRSVQAIALIALAASALSATTLHVGSGQEYANLQPAADNAGPGDTILVHDGVYAGGQYVTGLQGTDDAWVFILAAEGAQPVWEGSSEAWHLVEPAYVFIKGITFRNQTANGVNVDDGGTYETPAHHIAFDSCTFADMNASGNNDLLKLSGVDSFIVHGCTIRNGSAEGSGIDMVGCHYGQFIGNHFEDLGSNAIQAKGGTRHVTIERNMFINCGARTLNLGGSTGLAYFRPDTAHYEAADLRVYANVIVGSDAPIAYVGCVNVDVVNNTIFRPGGYTIRILQETVDIDRFHPCGNNSFRNNIVFRGDNWRDINLNSDTTVIAHRTFVFSNNLWYNYEDANDHAPKGLPVEDVDNVVGLYPRFTDTAALDLSIPETSPAAGSGLTVTAPTVDFAGNAYASPPSIGAFEAELSAVRTSPGYSVLRASVTAPHAILQIGSYPRAVTANAPIDLLGRLLRAGRADGLRLVRPLSR
ncbi:MAG: hypothetical protein GF331_18890 [Chitinivibrionales bacterium]|nr:hypothetical protein [Chitinivibrionales bacterium]